VSPNRQKTPGGIEENRHARTLRRQRRAQKTMALPTIAPMITRQTTINSYCRAVIEPRSSFPARG